MGQNVMVWFLSKLQEYIYNAFLSVSFRQAFHLHVKKEGERGNQK